MLDVVAGLLLMQYVLCLMSLLFACLPDEQGREAELFATLAHKYDVENPLEKAAQEPSAPEPEPEAAPAVAAAGSSDGEQQRLGEVDPALVGAVLEIWDTCRFDGLDFYDQFGPRTLET